MPIKDPSTPPPTIGKIGPYTVFVTPPSTPKPSEPSFEPPQKVVAPPVQPPPQIIHKSVEPDADASVSGFFRNAVNKVQNGISSISLCHSFFVWLWIFYLVCFLLAFGLFKLLLTSASMWTYLFGNGKFEGKSQGKQVFDVRFLGKFCR